MNNEFKIKCELTEHKSSLIARVEFSNSGIIATVPVSYGSTTRFMETTSSDEDIKQFVKDMLCTAVDKMVISSQE